MSKQLDQQIQLLNSDIQLTYNTKRENLYWLLDNKEIDECEFSKIMNQISDEEEACYGELAEFELED